MTVIETTSSTDSTAALLIRHGIIEHHGTERPHGSRAALVGRLRDLDAARGHEVDPAETDAATLTRHGVTWTATSDTPGIRWGVVSDRLRELDARLSPTGAQRVVLRSRLPETSVCCGARLTRPLLLDRTVPPSEGVWPCAKCGRTYRVVAGSLDPRTGGRRLQAARVPGHAA